MPCLDCGDEFHDDDCGGYNPECLCGCGCCRSCHDANVAADEDATDGDGFSLDELDHDDDDTAAPSEPSREDATNG